MNRDSFATDLASLAVPAPESLLPAVLVDAGIAHGLVHRPSPAGGLVVTFGPEGVTEVDLESEFDSAGYEERHGRPLVEVASMPSPIERHLDRAIAEGRPGRLPVDLSALTEFQEAVLRATAAIPRGEVRPYGWVAKEIGRPGAVRAVGSALAANPVPVIIPCHRVVRSDGSLGRYSMGESGNKRVLLEAEGLDVGGFESLAGSGVRFTGSDTTGIFCHPTCRHARRTSSAHQVEFRSEKAARQAGYRPCKVCRPVAAA